MYTDAQFSTQIGFRFAEFGMILDLLPELSPWGIFTAFMQSAGFLLGGDIVYVIYPLFTVSALSGVALFIFALTKPEDSAGRSFIVLRVAGAVVAVSVLFLCEEIYRFHAIWMGNNLATSVFILMLVGTFLLARKTKKYAYLSLGIIGSCIIISTRVEGVVYVAFILAAMASEGMEIPSKARRWLTGSLTVYTVIWNLLHFVMLGVNFSDSDFWTSSRGIMVCLLMVAVCCITPVLSLKGKIFDWAQKNYSCLFILGIILVSVFTIFIRPEMISRNVKMLLYHITSFFEVGVWVYILLLLPLLLFKNAPEVKFSCNLVLGYIFVLFVIFAFRSDVPLRTGLGDSGRRTLLQIIPVAVMLFSACSIERLMELFCKSSQTKMHFSKGLRKKN